MLESVLIRTTGATIFVCHVNDPERYSVGEFNNRCKAGGLDEKPKHPKSNYAVTGLYFYDRHVVAYEQSQGLKVACPEEIAYRQKWITATQLAKLAKPLSKNGYGRYLLHVLKETVF